MMTPLEVEILLHYHYSPFNYPDPSNAPAIAKAHLLLKSLGILAFENNKWFVPPSEKENLAIWVQNVCSVEYLTSPLKNKLRETENYAAYSKIDLANLADICWWLKGYVAAKPIDDPNDFGVDHVEILTKVINGLKINK